jgi:hypothetical protein
VRRSVSSVLSAALAIFVLTFTTGLERPAVAADTPGQVDAGSGDAAPDNGAPDANHPVAVITFSGWQELIDDLNFVGDVSDSPGLGSSIEGLLALTTGGQGLVGLRRDQPWGVAVSVVNNEPDILAFVPLKDLDRFLAALAGVIGPAPKDADGVYELDVMGQAILAKQHGEWAFIAMRQESLANLPDDPAAMVANLTKQYDVAIEVNMQNLPADFRDVALTQISLGLEQSMSRDEDESEEDYQARSEAAAAQIAEIEKAITQIDRLTVGWSINREDRKAYVDVMATAIAGSDLAEEFAGVSEGTTQFAGFESPEATVSALCTGAIATSDREQMVSMWASSREQLKMMLDTSDVFDDPRAKEVASSVMDDVFAALGKMMDADRVDGGMAVFGEGPFTIVAGGAVADSAVFENLVDDILKQVTAEFPSYEGYSRNVAEHKDLRFHTIDIPSLPDAEMLEAAREVFGDEISITVAVGDKRVFFGVGPGAIDRIRHVVDVSAEAGDVTIPPLRVRAKMSPLMGVLGELADRAAKQIEGELGNLGGQLSGDDDASEAGAGDDADTDTADAGSPDAGADDDRGISLFGGNGLGGLDLGPLPIPTTLPDFSELFVAMEAGKDNVELTVTAIPNGVRYHIVADEELLKLISAAAAMASQAAMSGGPGAGPFGPPQ